MTGAYFTPVAEGLQPVPQARSPWADDMLHGRLLAGLAARAAETDSSAGDAPFSVTRLTVDMFRSPPMTPLTVSTSVARAGGRVRLLDVSIGAGDVEVARATALLLRTGEHPDTDIWHATPWDVPPPEAVTPPVEYDDSTMGGWEIRLVNEGGFWSRGRKQLWSRDRWQLVAGEPLSPLVRAALSADLPNPMANAGADGLAFINADLTLSLARPPESEWIGLEVTNHIGHAGVAVGTCTMYDTVGAVGLSTVCAVTNPARLAP